MAGGNKKKKKPAGNPGRGFATTSIQSKSKIENVKDADSTDASGVDTPNAAPAEASVAVTKAPNNHADENGKPTVRELHELSPEEFEAHLETSELQQFVEKYASKVRKNSSRQVARMQTEKRILRAQADFLSMKDWLPEELMQQILDFIKADYEHDDPSAKKPSLPIGDDLVIKTWDLQICLRDLDVPAVRVSEAISWVLCNPPVDEVSSQVWGLNEALDWLAIYCEDGELVDYDSQRPVIVSGLDNREDIIVDTPGQGHAEVEVKKRDSVSGHASQPTSDVDSIDVSDVDSDLEPDELLSIYLRTKARLFDLNPSLDGCQTKKKGSKGVKKEVISAQPSSSGENKLRQKLRKIESDVLFDQYEADARWAGQRVELIRETTERKKLQLPGVIKPDISAGASLKGKTVTEEAEKIGQELLGAAQDMGNDDEDDLLGGLFSSVPGVYQQSGEEDTPDVPRAITVRDFGRLTGMNPKRVLEEACHARDSRCKIHYKQVSPTTYSCRHSVTIVWTKEQELLHTGFLLPLTVKSKPGSLHVAMMTEATPDVAQSEAYVATAALFMVFSASPKEEKCHLRLPPAFRDLWDEFLQLKREHTDAADRDTVKELRELIKSKTSTEDDVDDEVVFKASSRFRNGTSGTSTPITRPDTPKSALSGAAEILKDLWSRKTAVPSYQRMLSARMNLPMFHAKDVALEAIQRHQVVIVVGETGSGKSTQVPQFILEHELSQGRPCKIYCTEPRRISAISLARRVSEELGEHRGDLGTSRSLVGYAIRLESQTVAQTRLIYATTGIVLRMLESTDGLSEVTHLVLDEVHERTIDTDFLLIVLSSLLLKRPSLKVVLMSATVDAQKFSQYLGGAPIISVPGRTFPVQAKFLEDAIELTGHTNEDALTGSVGDDDGADSDRPDKSDATQSLDGYSKRTRNTLTNYDEYRIDTSLIVKLLHNIAHHVEYQGFSKAILVFLPGIAEIMRLNDMLLGHPSFSQGWRIHALHSTFSSEDQQAAFEVPPNGIRKIVLATNIAETGITIPDVTCVIDTGKHREMRFDERRQMSRLIQSFIARANAKQRRGRAGRVQEGICFHLFTRHRFEEVMVEQQTPEMLRLSLQDLVMRVKICKLGEIEHTLSQALDPPSSKNIRRAIDALVEVDALDPNEQLTPLGHQLAKLPLDAQLGKLLLLGAIFGCLDFTLTVAATLSSKSPFQSPMHAKKQADSVRLGFRRGDSDLLTVYNAYATWRKVCTTPDLSEMHFCNKNFLSAQNLANIEELKAQLLTSLVDAGFVSLGPDERAAVSRVRPGSRQRHFVALPAKYTRADANDGVAACVAAWSFYPKIVKRDGKGWRNVANNQSLGLHPTSVNKNQAAAPSSADHHHHNHHHHHHHPPPIKYLSFYSMMQSSSSRFTHAQETTPAAEFALVAFAGADAVFHPYAGVVVLDGGRLRFKVRDWRTLVVLKTLRARTREAMGRLLKYPGKELGGRQKRWMDLWKRIVESR